MRHLTVTLALAGLTAACATAPQPDSGFLSGYDGLVTRDYGAPVIYGGVTVLGRSLFVDTPDGPFSLYALMEAALERETLKGVVLDASWFHVGDPAALAEAERLLGAA